MLARRMLRRSISRTLAAPTPIASARARTTRASRPRFAGGRSFESRRPRMNLQWGGNTTAAAPTGPARGPRPASSTPATTPGTAAADADSLERLQPLLVALTYPHHHTDGVTRVEHRDVGLETLALDRP